MTLGSREEIMPQDGAGKRKRLERNEGCLEAFTAHYRKDDDSPKYSTDHVE